MADTPELATPPRATQSAADSDFTVIDDHELSIKARFPQTRHGEFESGGDRRLGRRVYPEADYSRRI